MYWDILVLYTEFLVKTFLKEYRIDTIFLIRGCFNPVNSNTLSPIMIYYEYHIKPLFCPLRPPFPPSRKSLKMFAIKGLKLEYLDQKYLFFMEFFLSGIGGTTPTHLIWKSERGFLCPTTKGLAGSPAITL